MEAELDWLTARVPPPGPIADLGCGSGNHAVLLARRGYAVTGIDFSPRMVAAAQRSASERGLDGVQVAAGDLNHPLDLPSGAFAGAVSSFVLQFVDDPAALLSEVHRILGPGGVLFLAAPSSDLDHSVDEGANRYWRVRRAAARLPGFIHCFTDDELRALVAEAGFTVLDYRRYPGGHVLLARAAA
jgi:SAM-dependent methyltransferase